MDLIEEAKLFIKEGREKGVECPCCSQFVKLYKRKLNSTMAACLVELNKLDRGFYHMTELATEVPKFIVIGRGGDFAKLQYWGLIEERLNDNFNKKNSGFWRITDKGISFAKNEIKIPKHIFLYNGKLEGFSEEKTNIEESLGNKFNYRELMCS